MKPRSLLSILSGAYVFSCAVAAPLWAEQAVLTPAVPVLDKQDHTSAPAKTPAAQAPVQSAHPKDPMVGVLDAFIVPDWQSVPAQVFVSSGPSCYATGNGATWTMPGGQPIAILQEYGCSKIVAKRFQRPQRSVQIAVYEFEDTRGAYGAYTSMRQGSSNVVARGDASSEDDNSISIFKGHYFIVLTATADEDELSKTLISSLAEKINVTIDDHAHVPDLVEDLPGLDKIKGSERYFMGPQAARMHVILPFLANLQLEKSNGAAFAQYQFFHPNPERMKVMLIDFGNPMTLDAVLSSYIQTVSDGHKTEAVFLRGKICKLKDSYLLVNPKGQRLIVIAGAKKKASAAMLARQLSY